MPTSIKPCGPALRLLALGKGEIWNQRKNGEVYPESLSVTAVKNDEGNTSHYVGVFADISTRKAIEEKVEHLAFYDPPDRFCPIAAC